jgi:hypothetical protein
MKLKTIESLKKWQEKKKESWPNLKNKKNENFRLKDAINNKKKTLTKRLRTKE